jgi:adenylate kinase
MRVAVTGTPGTGKTTAVEQADIPLEIIHLNDLIRETDMVVEEDRDRDTVVADIEAIQEHLAGQDDVLVESHLAHHLSADRVIVLRCHPGVLSDRLRERGVEATSITENAESEALDVILTEAVRAHGEDSVYEVETTDRTPAAVAREIEAVVAGDRSPRAGAVDYTDYL